MSQEASQKLSFLKIVHHLSTVVKPDRSSVIARFESAENRRVWTPRYVYRSRGGTLRKIV